jgi:CRP-like cAMP-binding protein
VIPRFSVLSAVKLRVYETLERHERRSTSQGQEAEMRQRFFDELAADVGADAEPLIQGLAERTVTVRRKRQQTFHLQNGDSDGIRIVGHGAVMLEWRRRNGFPMAFRLALAGDHFGARSFCADEPHSTTARALRDTLVLHIGAADLKDALRQAPRLWAGLARMVARDAGPELAKILRSARIPVRARLAWLLSYLDDRLDRRLSNPGSGSGSPLKQRDLAYLLDVTDETISRSLHALENDELLCIHNGNGGLRITDRAALEREFSEYL